MRISDWSADVCSSDLLSYTIIRAPFDGIVDLRLVELGDFVDRGDTNARLVDLDPMLIVTQVNERDVQSLTVGAPGKARLIGGLTVEGRIRHISSVADEATRTFRVELEVPNPDRRIANRSEEHTSELQSLMRISSAAF